MPGVAKGVLCNGMAGNMAQMRMSFFLHAKVESISAAQAKVHATRHACVCATAASVLLASSFHPTLSWRSLFCASETLPHFCERTKCAVTTSSNLASHQFLSRMKTTNSHTMNHK